MSSVSKSCPPVVYSGDVGVLLDESPQRLLSVLSEAAMACLQALKEMTARHSPAKFDKLYGAGIKCIGTWNSEVIREEVSKLTSKYPECADLYKFTYLSILRDLRPDLDQFFVPAFDDFYHCFMRRVSGAADVCKGEYFFALPFAHKRVVFVECFRNALHDMARKFSIGPALAKREEDGRGELVRRSPPPRWKGYTEGPSGEKRLSQVKEEGDRVDRVDRVARSLLTQATLIAREERAEPKEPKESKEPNEPKARDVAAKPPQGKAPPPSDGIAPSSNGNGNGNRNGNGGGGSKNIELRNEPCFFSPAQRGNDEGDELEPQEETPGARQPACPSQS
jgi:hypothetical protein